MRIEASPASFSTEARPTSLHSFQSTLSFEFPAGLLYLRPPGPGSQLLAAATVQPGADLLVRHGYCIGFIVPSPFSRAVHLQACASSDR